MLHRFLVRLENDKSFAPKDTVSLLIRMRKISEEHGSIVKNIRVTESAIEFDLYVLDAVRKDLTIAKLEKEIGKKASERDLEERDSQFPPNKGEVVKESARLFDDQRYWECHETLEQIWRQEPKGPEKDVQQGIILAASALVHYQKSEDQVCIGMIPKSLAKLEKWNEKYYYSIDIERLKDDLKNIEKSGKIRPFKI